MGCPISTEDHIEAILDGFSDEYDSFITSVTSHLDPYMVADIEALLLAQESRIEKAKQSVDHILQANVPSSFSPYNSSSTNHHPSFRPSGLVKQRFYSKPRFPASKNFTKMPSNSSSSLVQCQICGKYGHIALHCWHRFDFSNPSQVTANTGHFLHLLVMMNFRSSKPPILYMTLFGILIVVPPIISLLTATIFQPQPCTQVRKGCCR